ncbi:MAG: hypothetical protein KBC17_02105 [Candidatus Pacebacteria bacterium]|nr:hypothetical protein [Candidatus Paceibacterota bacterium]
MATTLKGQSRMISAFGFRNRTSSKFKMLRHETGSMEYKSINPWKDWYLAGFTITNHTLSLTDQVGGNIFILAD